MTEINWTAPEYEYRPKSVSWFWISIIIAVLIIALAVWQKNFFFVFFVVVAELLLIVWGNREPRPVQFSISETGLTVDGNKFYAWSEIENWSAGEPGELEYGDVILNFRGQFRPNIRVLLPKGRFEKIKNAFGDFLPEVEREESLIDSLGRLLGF